MRVGFALPQYDCSVGGEAPLTFATIEHHARRAEQLGFDSLWVSDHLTWDLAKYGGSEARYGVYDPLVLLSTLARTTTRVRLGTLVLCEALRPPAVLAKALATIDRLSGGRLDVGMGAGWYEPDYSAVGLQMPSPGVRLARLEEAATVVKGLLADPAPIHFVGSHYRVAGARNAPMPVQPAVPVFAGGRGDRFLRLVARTFDGWNTCWSLTPDAYRERLAVLEQACDAAGRDPRTVWRSLGLYALCGESEADLARRFARLQSLTPPGILDHVSFSEWRKGKLVGTVEAVRDQVEEWGALGVETIVLGAGAVPFQVGSLDDVEALAEALRLPIET